MTGSDTPPALFDLPPAAAPRDVPAARAGDAEGGPDPAVDHRIDVVGHGAAQQAMARLARGGQAGQPVLLVGAPGVGKRTLARRFAQTLLCTADAEARPCGGCRACRLVAADSHPDVVATPAPLRIDAARAFMAGLSLSPLEGRVRVGIVPQIDDATIGAANSLLKTLEEPPRQTALVLTACREADVLPTIRSRCRRIDLHPVAAAELADALVSRWAAAPDAAALLARLGGGAPGRALAYLADAAALDDRRDWLDRLFALLAADRAERLSASAQLARLRDALATGIGLWCGAFRDVLLVQHGLADHVTHRDRQADLERLAGALSPADAVHGARAAERALGQLAAHANPQLVLDVLTLALPATPR